MSKYKIKEGTTSKLVKVFIQDSSATDGSGLTGLVYNSSGLTAYWSAEGDASATQITLATMTAGTWASGGFVEYDATNMPGVYEVGLPDACVDATSEGSVLIHLKGATNMAPCLMELELDGIDYTTAISTQVDASTLATEWQDGGRLDLILDTADLWSKRAAVILSGTIADAGTGTETFTVSALGITATVTVDGSGNRSSVVWS